MGLRGRPLPAGEGRDPGAGAGAPRLRRPGRATACGSARRCAPAGLALHSPSLHQRLRELGRDPSLAHFPPSQTRTLPRSRSLSLAHTHARTRRRGSPSRARSPSGSSGRPPRSGLARPRRGSRPTQRPEAAGLGEPRAAPRGKSAGCRGRGGRIAAEGRLPSREGAPWPAGAARQAARGGRASRRRRSPVARARALRAPSSRRGGQRGSFPRPNFPRRGAEPPVGPEPAVPASPPPHPPRAPEPLGPPRVAGWQRRGPSPRAERGWGGGAQPRHGDADPGAPGAPHCLLPGFGSRAPPRGGVRAGKYSTA